VPWWLSIATRPLVLLAVDFSDFAIPLMDMMESPTATLIDESGAAFMF
jgi:hypothetical protein